MSLSLDLPVEIIHNIIDVISRPNPETGAYDRETLKSCALISRTCVEIAQKHLFYTITIQLRHQLRLCLLHRILERNESIGTHVKELVLLDVGPDNGRIYQEPDHDTFDLILECFPMLQRLEILSWGVDLARFDWHVLRRSTQVALEHILASEHFESLRLSFTRRWPLSALSKSPGLRCLDLDFSELYDDISQDDVSSSAHALKLRCLKASKSSRAVHTLWRLALQNQQSFVNFGILEELQFDIYGVEDIKIFGQLMSLVGPNLRRLKLVIETDFDTTPSIFLASMNASRLENIEYLEFHFGDEDHTVKVDILDVIAEMKRSYKLVEIKIAMPGIHCIGGEEIKLAECPMWIRFDEALAQSSFYNLRVVTLDIGLIRRPREMRYNPASRRLAATGTEPIDVDVVKQVVRNLLAQLSGLVQLVINVEVID